MNDVSDSTSNRGDNSNVDFIASDFCLNYVQNKENVCEKDVKLLTNVPEITLQEFHIKSFNDPEKLGHEENDDNVNRKNESHGDEQAPDTPNLSFDFIKNDKKEDIKIGLLANERKNPKKGDQEQCETKKDDEEKIETPQMDPRFPNQNQTSYCWSSYIDYHRCVNLLGENNNAAKYFKKVYTSLCPNRWIERWDEQRANGTFPAIIDRVKLKEDSETCDKTKDGYEECKKRQEEKAKEKKDAEAEAEKKKAETETVKEEVKKKKGKKFFRW